MWCCVCSNLGASAGAVIRGKGDDEVAITLNNIGDIIDSLTNIQQNIYEGMLLVIVYIASVGSRFGTFAGFESNLVKTQGKTAIEIEQDSSWLIAEDTSIDVSGE